MRLSLKIAAALSVFASSHLFAATTLVVPQDIKLLAVNMEEPKLEGSLFSAEKTLDMPDGTNQIVFKYQPQFEVDDTIRHAYSDVIIAKFHVANETVTFKLPEFRTYRLAQRSISPLEWQLLDSNGRPITLVEDTLDSEGVQLGRNYLQEARNYNVAGGVASIAVTYVTVDQQQQIATGMALKSSNTQSLSAKDSQIVDLLKTMYQKASPEEQAAFKDWVAKQ